MNSLVAQDKTQYLLHEIPQSISLNPAIAYSCGNYIELPAISQLQFYYRNSGFSHKQAFDGGKGISGDTTELDLDGLARALGNRNHVRFGTKINILGFGFAVDDWFFSMNVNNRSSLRLSFNRDIVDVRDGNWDLTTNLPREININGTGIHLSSFTEFAFGAGFMIYPGFSVGIRAKYLLGSAHLQTRKSNIRILTAESPIKITGLSDLLIRGSLPVTIQEGTEGYVTGVQSDLSNMMDFLLSWNHGFAMDAGLIYDYSDKITLSASLLDLGFIRWRKNISVISQEEDFVFQGIDLNNYLISGDETDFFQALEDSVYNSFRLSGSNDPYTAAVPVRLMAGVDYKWKKKISLGAVFEGEILSNRFYPTLTLTAVSRFYDNLTASLSYSLMDRGFSSIGFGMVFGNGPLQLYLVSDNIPINYVRETELGLFWPYSARTMNIRAGLNIIFGCKDKMSVYQRLKWRKSCPAYN
ncbi:MAG: DUF5723 family protein [bacterium]